MAYLEAREISCRVQQISERGLSLLLYVTSRAGQNKLDEKYGELGWKDSYSVKDGQLFCSISAWNKEIKEWVQKEDVGTASYTEKEKGRASDAFKRACVKHGIARELYSAPFIYIPAGQCNIKNRKDKYYTNDRFLVNKITYTARGEIDELEIVNQALEIVYKKFGERVIDEIKYKVLLDKMQRANVEAEAILSLLPELSSLKDMKIDDFIKICNKLDKTIEQSK